MKSVRKITEKSKAELAGLPVGFPIEFRGKDQEGDWCEWTQGTVADVHFVDGYLEIDIKYWYVSGHVCNEYCHAECDNGTGWRIRSIFETIYAPDFRDRNWHEARLGWTSGHRLAAVRWSPEALRAFRALSDDLVLAQTVASLLVSR
jgi:hypothetical protein